MKKNLHLNHLPDLLEIQRSSFCWFLSEGLATEVKKLSSIFNLEKNLEIRIYGSDYKLQKPEGSPSQAKQKTLTYSLKLYVSTEIVKSIKKPQLHHLKTTESVEK